MGKTISDLKIGDKASFEKTITEVDISLFAGISGDFNPIHINLEAIKKTKYKGRLAHGLLTASLISAVIGTKLPGIGTLYLKQDLEFLEPVFVGDTIKATVVVTEINIAKNIAILDTFCINQNGVTVIKGIAIVKPPLVIEEA
jgi:3-hydroxybutyryl-CoA dehydratase